MKAFPFLTLVLFFSISGCAFIKGLKEEKTTPPAATASGVSVPTTSHVKTRPINTNTPTSQAAKTISPAM